jgi:hypothetical protein
VTLEERFIQAVTRADLSAEGPAGAVAEKEPVESEAV